MRSKPRFAMRKVYMYSCSENWCDCGGQHYSYEKKAALAYSRAGYDAVVARFEVKDYALDTVIADCWLPSEAKMLVQLLNAKVS